MNRQLQSVLAVQLPAFVKEYSIMARHRLLNRLPRRITGAAAIEFAFVFPILFAIIYGTIAYGYVYFLQQRINFIAQEAVRTAISVAPAAPATYASNINDAVNLFVTQYFSLEGGKPPALTVEPPIINSGTNILSIRVTYNLTTPTLFPTVTLPMGIGSIPPLPATLTATAAGRLS